MPTVLVAPTAYKGTLSPSAAAAAMVSGLQDAGIASVVPAPLADGGDGTVESLHMAVGGQLEKLVVTGPLGQPVQATWLRLADLAVIELASASGLALVGPDTLEPLAAHTIGTGQLLASCLASGMGQIVVAAGGSASTDGGTGALRALGARFLDAQANELPPGGGALVRLSACDLDALERWAGKARILVATDVTNPLLGKRGAARVYAPQKGASAEQVELLELALKRLADVLERQTGCRARRLPGSGAAGGTAFGLVCALAAEIIPGFKWLSALTGLESKVASADLVITGEGRLDEQSLSGKVIGELAALCRKHRKRLWALPARVQPGIDWSYFAIERVLPVARGAEPVSASDIRRAARQAAERFLDRPPRC